MKNIRILLTLSALFLLAACGGGGGGGGGTGTTTTVSGVASAGIIKGGTVKVFKPYSSLSGIDKKQIGADSQTSLTDGSYSVSLGSYTGPVVVEITGGSYIDEADVAAGPKTIPAGAPLRAVISNATGAVTVPVTPLTELAVKQAREQDRTLGAAAIDKANAQVSDLFKVDIINTKPLDASSATAVSAGTQAEQNYTLALAALSQLTKSSALSLDATLGALAGNINANGGMAAASASAVSGALTTFLADTTNNKTGIAALPATLQNIGSTSLKLFIALTGTGVRGVESTLVLPAGVSAAADTTGATLAGVLLPAGNATLTSISGKFTPALASTPGSLHLILLNDKAVIGAGDFAVASFNVAPGAAVPVATDFTLKSNSTTLFDINGASVTGSLALHL